MLVESWQAYLRAEGWFSKKMHGSQFQAGFPDLYATHKNYRVRLIEIKLPTRGFDPYTPAQLEVFQMLCAHGSPVWTLTGVWSPERKQFIASLLEYEKLFGPQNWYRYLGVMK